MMAFVNIGAAFIVRIAVASGERIEVERQGKIVVSPYFLDQVQTAIRYPAENGPTLDSSYCSSEARDIAEKYGGTQAAVDQKLRDAFRTHGARDFITKDDPSFELAALSKAGPFPAMLG